MKNILEMDRKEIVMGWKIRCVEAGVSLSSVLEAAGFDASVASHWSNSDKSAPEAEFIAELSNHIPFDVIYNIVGAIEWPAAGRSRVIDTFVRIENAMREAEKKAVAR